MSVSAMSARRSISTSDENGEGVCVVCFKSISIYAVGECDHICCYECSTRIRVLCRQNECPICRRDLSKVIFSKKLIPYQQLDTKNRSGLYDKKYRICFVDSDVQNAFFDLLDNKCPRCNIRPFHKFEHLKEHVRKDHEMFYCDICTEHLKIFSTERRCYTRQELATHRRKGDPDNKGHRGHPLCEYCDTRYLDKDELFRHLRKEHYFCHFCDAEGANHFYGDYNTLRDHFRSEHYLCEEGDCEQEQFTAVFRSEIDLKAHRASVHGKMMNKYANKQTRTLELEFSYAPRNRTNHHPGESSAGSHRGGGGHHNNNRNSNNHHNRGPHFEVPPEFDNNIEATQHQAKKIDAQSEQEFPSLGGGGGNVPGSRPGNVSIRRFKVFGTAGLARTKENFPALGTNDETSSSSGNNNDGFNRIPASSLLKNNSQPLANPQKPVASISATKPTTSSMMIHVSNRPNSTKQQSGKSGSDFPALPGTAGGKNKSDLFADMEEQSDRNGMVNLNAISAKHRALVNEYVPIANTVASKVALAPVEKEVKKVEKPVSAPKINSNNAFPALGNTSSANSSTAQWVLSKTVSKPKDSKKSKVAAAPDLSENKYTNLNALKNSENNKKSIEISDNLPKKDAKVNKKDDKKNNNEVTGPKTNSSKKKSDDSKTNKENEETVLSADNFPSLSGEPPKRGPPGFNDMTASSKAAAPQPPPGFNVTLNSVARNVNKLTFTNSVGESFNISPSPHHVYTPPPNAHKRNQVLVTHFQKTLRSPEALNEFRQISQMFRDGTYFAVPYYEHCKIALGAKFDEIFPELLSMLPDIVKQQELYLVYSQEQKKSKQKSKLEQIEVCATCKQVLQKEDVQQHVQSHFLENNFPLLGNGEESGKVSSSSSAWKNKQ